MIRFLLAIAGISAAMLVTVRLWLATPPSWDFGIVAFLALSTSLIYFLLQKPKNAGDPEKFTQLYLLSITVKIVIAGAFVIVFVLMDREGADSNAVFFLIGYVIFTAAEVIFLLLKPAAGKP